MNTWRILVTVLIAIVCLASVGVGMAEEVSLIIGRSI